MATHHMSRSSVSEIIAQLFRLALEYHKAGFLLNAAELYAEVCIADPLNADARFLLGVIARQTRKFRPAAKLVAQAIALNPRQIRFQRELKVIRSLESKASARRRPIYPGNTNTPEEQGAVAATYMRGGLSAWMPMATQTSPSGMAAHA